VYLVRDNSGFRGCTECALADILVEHRIIEHAVGVVASGAEVEADVIAVPQVALEALEAGRPCIRTAPEQAVRSHSRD